MANALDISGHPVNYDSRTEWRARPTTLTYRAAEQLIVISNGFSVMGVLRAGGYTFHAFTKTWRKRADLDELTSDCLLLANLGVVIDPQVAALVTARPVEPAPKPVEAHQSPPQPRMPANAPELTLDTIKRAQNIALTLANSMRIPERQDREALREVSCILRAIITHEESIQTEELSYGQHEEAAQ